MHSPFYRSYLEAELARRCRANSHYSLRAYARALGTDAGTLSRVISGKRPLSVKIGKRILERLCLSAQERSEFVISLAAEQRQRQFGEIDREVSRDPAEWEKLEQDYFEVIGDWYHCALLELTFVRGFKSDPRWIASQLGISVSEAQLAIARLVRLGLLDKTSGSLKKTNKDLSTADKTRTSAHLRRHTKQLLEKAVHSLENDPIETRSMSNMFMAIDPEKIPLARKLIEKFAIELCQTLETSRPKRVYNLGVSLFPLQKNEDKHAVG